VQVEVAFALPDRQRIISLQVSAECTALEAARQSGISNLFPEIDLDSAKMGIFGKVLADPSTHRLREGDRVEIYRPLMIDPKEARRARARKLAHEQDD